MNSSERTPQQQLSLFFLIWTGCFLFFSLLAQGVLMLYFGKEGYHAFVESGAGFAAQDIPMARMLQIFLSLGLFAFPPVVFALLTKPRDWGFFRVNKFPDGKLLALTVLLAGFSLPVVAWALEVNQAYHFPPAFQQFENYLRDMEGQNTEFLQMMLNMESNAAFLMNFLMIAIIPPVAEELLFRGTMQQLLQKQVGPHVAILLTGAFFSFIHMEFYGFLPRMMLGVLFGYLFLWSGSLWVPIFAHFLHNGLQIAMLFLFQRGIIKLDIEQMDSFPPFVTMGATVLLFVTLSIFDFVSRKQNPDDGKRLGESIHNK